MRIKKDDTVVVITGKDKGKTGKVLKAMPKENKVIVQGVNMLSLIHIFEKFSKNLKKSKFSLEKKSEVIYTVIACEKRR